MRYKEINNLLIIRHQEVVELGPGHRNVMLVSKLLTLAQNLIAQRRPDAVTSQTCPSWFHLSGL